ncbi:hypothetical protein K437DRAFT_283192 [Tilletiaria anomala UBC 951]|uniref:DUF590-domain-containing protein n=1 Tax=Tilletiaria anomala (strain ATCC 24038 / CBS 436.72 / UBC 951) TaxID=1037660 RepID=A0A066WHQ3_TILAU|nr:uncharacterized protein K437DRAFT_283192 [Tilletiaria anomala UBC 951]KDN53326.1 hypothetical protein K437DRAFT_283192 [Tilletiaria anomala UBC 951]
MPSEQAAPNLDQPPLVIIFQAIPKTLSRSKSYTSSDERHSIAQEYERLLQALRKAGLHVTTREGTAGSGNVLIFVRASMQALYTAAARERMSDYLHGVRSSSQTPVSFSRTSSLSTDPFASIPSPTSADVLRFTHSLVTTPPCHDSNKAWHTISGANIQIKCSTFPHVVDIVPLHEVQYNKQWLKQWTAPSSAFTIGAYDLDSVRCHFGEQIAFYFGFLVFYFNSLLPMAVWGFLFWAARRPYDPIYSLGLVAWACVFVEAWRLRERKLAVRWGCSGVSHAEARRPEFKPRCIRKDPVTGEELELFEWWRKEARMALALPVMLIFAALLGAVMTLMFIIEVFVSKMYTGPGRTLVPLVPTAMFTTAVPSIMAAWQATASALTNFENHRTDRTHQSSLTLKMFTLQAFVAYGALTLSAFVYVPFGQKVMDTLMARGFLSEHVSLAVQKGYLKYDPDGRVHFDINPNRMHLQLFAASVTSQAINAFTELFFPILLRAVKSWRSERAAARQRSGEKNAGGTGAHRDPFVTRALEEISLPSYDIFGDYAEMATQFGFITLWSAVWPMSPVIGFVNNFFEIRSDAAKICMNARRPVPVRVESVGPWIEVLGFISWLAALVNAALLYLFGRAPYANTAGHSAYATVLRQYGPGVNVVNATQTSQSSASLSEQLPIDMKGSANESALLVALLIAIASEHGYAIFRAAARHVLVRAVWRGSTEAEVLMQREWQSRRALLKMHEKAPDEDQAAIVDSLSAFWKEDGVSKEWIENTKTD